MNQQRQTSSNNFRPSGDFGISGPTFLSNVNGSSEHQRIAPPLPPRVHRPAQSYQRSSDSNYHSGYGAPASYRSYRAHNPYGSYSGLSGYGGYGGYGSYGSYGSLGYQNHEQYGDASGNIENRFLQIAEESTRPAFQSIESMVHTFSSVTVMLESTFFAMNSSFRAILSVAENFGRMRSMFSQVVNTFSLIRLTKWLYKKSMYMLGLRPDDPNSDILWNRAALEVMNGQRTGPATWPILMFFSLLFLIPYLIHKLVSNSTMNNINVNNPKEWLRHQEPVYTATAAYDFNAGSSDELNLKVGQKIWLAPKSLQPTDIPGWYRATDTVNVGLVPASYVIVVGQLKKKSESLEPPRSTHYNENTSVHIDHESDHDTECHSPDLSKE